MRVLEGVLGLVVVILIDRRKVRFDKILLAVGDYLSALVPQVKNLQRPRNIQGFLFAFV
jgi:hypothetical protein